MSGNGLKILLRQIATLLMELLAALHQKIPLNAISHSKSVFLIYRKKHILKFCFHLHPYSDRQSPQKGVLINASPQQLRLPFQLKLHKWDKFLLHVIQFKIVSVVWGKKTEDASQAQVHSQAIYTNRVAYQPTTFPCGIDLVNSTIHSRFAWLCNQY